MTRHHVDIVEYAKDLAQTVEDFVLLSGYDNLAELHDDDPILAGRIAESSGYHATDDVGWVQLVNEWVLDVDHFRSTTNPDSVITKVLFSCGGPHVYVTILPDDSAELFHSWGVSTDRKKGVRAWRMGSEFGEQLRQLVGPFD